VGKASNLTGLSSCSDCDKGYYQPSAGQTSCVKCAAGDYNFATAQTFCSQCGVGSYSNSTASTACLSCAPGTVQPQTGRSTCDLCTPGSYQNFRAHSFYLPCAAGTYTNSNGVFGLRSVSSRNGPADDECCVLCRLCRRSLYECGRKERLRRLCAGHIWKQHDVDCVLGLL
jgi:hypothetical protein